MAEDKAAQIETLVQEDQKADIVPEGSPLIRENIMASKTEETESDVGRVEQHNEVFLNDLTRMASPSCPDNSPMESQFTLAQSTKDANGDYMSQISSKGKLPMKASDTSFWYTNFLDQSRILNSKGPEASQVYERKFQPNGVGYGAPLSWNKPTSIGPEMSKWQDILFGNSKRISPEWSGEELDFLWIGVRRHGENNWNAMLTDPELHFLESRVAEELADKWTGEKRRISKGSFIEPIRLPTPHLSPSPFLAKSPTNNHYSGSTFLPRDPKPQTFREETTRSFGDPFLYSENNSKSSVPHSSGVIIAKPISCRPPSEIPYLGSTPIRSASSSERNQPQNSTSKWGLLMCARSSPIREMALKTKRRRPSVPKSMNALVPSRPVPPGPPRCYGVLKRKSVKSGDGDSSKKVRNTACIDEEWLRKRLCMSPNVGLTFQNPTSDDTYRNPIDPQSNFVATDTGASSEDTL